MGWGGKPVEQRAVPQFWHDPALGSHQARPVDVEFQQPVADKSGPETQLRLWVELNQEKVETVQTGRGHEGSAGGETEVVGMVVEVVGMVVEVVGMVVEV